MSTTLESLRWQKFPVLDDGSVCLVDVMGDDAAIAAAARISYGKGTRPVSEDRDLIRYLMRHEHMTPFEMAEIKIRVRVPMDTWRQWIRHRAAHVNEYSTRYSEAIDALQATAPDAWRLQAKDNKQGSAGFVTEWPAWFEPTGHERDSTYAPEYPADTPGQYLSDQEDHLRDHARRVYGERLAFGVAREQARKDLPLSTYTEAIWKCDLRNVLHFLRLRLDTHAQAEIRAYANVIANEIVAPLFPITWQAFVNYHLEAVTLSGLDVGVVRAIHGGLTPDGAMTAAFGNKREREECRAKLVRLGIVQEGSDRE